MTEGVILRGIMDYLNTRSDLYWFRAGSGAMKTESGRYFKTGRPGCPDIIVFFRGQGWGIECKTLTGKQSLVQKNAEMAIRATGNHYYIVRSIADVKSLLAP